MPIDKEKLREYFSSLEREISRKDYTIPPEVIEKFNKSMERIAKNREEYERNQREFLTTCRCHTGGHCYFHTEYM